MPISPEKTEMLSHNWLSQGIVENPALPFRVLGIGI